MLAWLQRLLRRGEEDSSSYREYATAAAEANLQAFLESGAVLTFSDEPDPAFSVILILYNRAELTLRCLQSLSAVPAPSFEVVIVDNASTDATARVLSRVRGARVRRQSENLGFLRGVNLAAAEARGRHLLLLNNDTEVMPNTLEELERHLTSGVGAVGGKLLLPDGSLQEAGSIIWNDGSCVGYGRGDDPDEPMYSFTRDVDYCSGALLATPRALFQELGGFDDRYEPAYYEDSDYCVRVWKRGLRVVYAPRAVVHHFEFASARSPSEANRLQRERRGLFSAAHSDWLAERPPPTADPLTARSRGGGLRILCIDDRIPHRYHGAGNPRTADVLHAITELGHQVTYFPWTYPDDVDWPAVYEDLPDTVEIMRGYGAERFGEFLARRASYFDVAFVARPHNMREVLPHLRPSSSEASRVGLAVVYDTEALWSERDAERRRLAEEPVPPEVVAEGLSREFALGREAHTVITVSASEGARFEAEGSERVRVLSHQLSVDVGPENLADRTEILFVGAFTDSSDSPNSDSVQWFVHEILPSIRGELDRDVPLSIVGSRPPPLVRELAGAGVEVVGRVGDLRPFYRRARLFVAPTRFAAGIPYKVHHAAANGVPVVCTPILAQQLGWTHGEEVLVGGEPSEFAQQCVRLLRDDALWRHIRARAEAAVRRDCSEDAFREALQEILEPFAHSSPAGVASS